MHSASTAFTTQAIHRAPQRHSQKIQPAIAAAEAEAERHGRLLALATQRVNEAPAALAAAEAEATAAKDGTALVRVGLAYSGLGQHDKGIALIEQGIAKGGIKRIDDARLHLGFALLRAGQKGRAAQVFKTVGGNDGTADLARLLTGYRGYGFPRDNAVPST